MICDICHIREAKIIYTEIINGQKKEQHLCESCASEQTLAIKDKLGNEIPIGSILSGILQNYAKGIAAKSANEPVCMRCGMTASDLVKGGRLGCPECYNAFSMILDKNLKTVQGAVEHHGKVPANAVKTEVKPAAANIRTAADIMNEAADEIARKNSPAAQNGKKAVAEDKAPDSKAIDSPETVASDDKSRLDAYKSKLAEALAVEDYEEAARLRDIIHGLEADERPAKKTGRPRKASPKGGSSDEC